MKIRSIFSSILNSFYISFICLALTSTAQAKGLGCTYYVDFGLGKAFDTHIPSASYSAALPVATGVITTFLISPKGHNLYDNLALEAGLLWENAYRIDSPYFPFINLGLSYRYSNFTNEKTLTDFTFISQQAGFQPLVLTSQTNYEFLQRSLLANLKLDVYRWGHFMPYVNLGLGASWNKSKQKAPFFIKDPDTTNPAPITLTTSSSDVSSFSYQVGAGLDYLVTENFWLSLGYIYNNFGRVEVGKLLSASLNDVFDQQVDAIIRPFSLRNLTTHTIQLTGRYVFG
ncbi:MAG: outer membrane beta-barrel protein [Rickettsiella sp.]|nr:outer membrane beta-barrel protein [Rickettsiella sp.]